jgi:anti-sigma regulatory factor (Ser/Thr protein kinase)
MPDRIDAEQPVAVPSIAIELPAVAASVSAARHRARAFAAANGVGANTLAAIALAVSEAVGNAVRHAYPAAVGAVQVLVDLEGGELELVVTDDGQGFTTRPVRRLGAGLALMRELSDAFEVRDRPLGGVEVWMRFGLAS